MAKSETSIFSEEKAKDFKVRILDLAKKGSPRLRATIQGLTTEVLIDEGSELDCLDEDFQKKLNLRLAPSDRSATAAGNTDLVILGETLDDVVLDTRFQSSHVPINLGRATVIRNLGCSVILGEPGKRRNGIRTDPQKRLVILEREGQILEKPYLESSSTRADICRLKEGPVTIYENDILTFPVSSRFHNREVAVTPRGQYNNIFKASVQLVEKGIKLQSFSPTPITIKTNEHLADIRHVNTVKTNADVKVNSGVHDHDDDTFKFDSVEQKPRETKQISGPEEVTS